MSWHTPPPPMNATPERRAGPNAGPDPRDRRARALRSRSARALLALWAVAAVVFFAAPAERAMAQTGPATPVDIPDANLRARLESALGKAPGATITRAEMATLGVGSRRFLNLSRTWATRYDPEGAIRDLTGLEYATGVWVLDLRYNFVSDLSPLAPLFELATLILRYNRISDITPLDSLRWHLVSLDIRDNLVSDLTPLARVHSLTTLHLENNRIADLSPLARLTRLQHLNLSNNRIRDLTPLARLTSMENLQLVDNPITDLAPLRDMTSLEYLTIRKTLVKNLEPLTGLSGLRRLALNSNRIEDLSPLVASSGFVGAGANWIDLRDNPDLDEDAAEHVAALRGRGITIYTNDPLPLNRTVRGVRVTRGVRELKVTWEPLTDYDPSGYRVFWKSGTQIFTRTATPPRDRIVTGVGTTTYTIPDLTPGVEYAISVRANQPNGPLSRIVYGVPLAPEEVEEARGRALGPVLAGMGRMIAADAVDMVEERFESRRGGGQAALGGLALTRGASGTGLPPRSVGRAGARRGGAVRHDRYSAAPAPRAGSGRQTPLDAGGEGFRQASAAELLSRSSFDLPLSGRDASGAADDMGWRLWGRGTAGGFEGEPAPGFRMEGEVSGGYVGLDWRPYHDVMLGMAIGHASGEADYEADGVASTDGEVDLELTSLLPYAHWKPRPDLGVWGLLGAGWGDVELKDEMGEVETDAKMRMVASGLRQEVATWRGIDLAVKADTFWTELETVAARGLPEAKGVAKRLRLRMEGRTEWEISAVSRVASTLDLGGRWDGGDAETGLGAEVGGSLAYAHTGLGLAVDARGRYLVAHRESAFEEWGGSLTATLDPGQAGVGPSLRLTPGWGAEGSRIAQIWDGAEVLRSKRGVGGRSRGLSPDRFALDAGYGLTSGARGLLTPYAGLSITRPSMRGYKAGARLEVGEQLDMGVEGRRSRWAAGGARNEVMLHVRVRW